MYVGVTSDLVKRVWEHKNHVVKSFTDEYNVDKLGYFEIFDGSVSAISREKQIETKNPLWIDLYSEII